MELSWIVCRINVFMFRLTIADLLVVCAYTVYSLFLCLWMDAVFAVERANNIV